VVAGWQLRGLGLDWQTERRRVSAARLFRVRPGVFTVGRAGLSEAGRFLAATQSYGPGLAVISHRAAAGWWRVLPPTRGVVDVIAATGTARRGTRLHRVTLSAGERGGHRGVPVTSVGRTLADLATQVRPNLVECAVHEGQVLGLLTRGELTVAAAASEKRQGGAHLRRLLEEIDPDVVLRSHLERRFLARVKEEGLPLPIMNHRVDLGPRIVDFDAAWPDRRLAVELDSAFHDTPTSRRADAERDQDAAAAGWQTIRLRMADLHRPNARVHPGSIRNPMRSRKDRGFGAPQTLPSLTTNRTTIGLKILVVSTKI
jgi:very-short-patch-repair endonuclease